MKPLEPNEAVNVVVKNGASLLIWLIDSDGKDEKVMPKGWHSHTAMRSPSKEKNRQHGCYVAKHLDGRMLCGVWRVYENNPEDERSGFIGIIKADYREVEEFVAKYRLEYNIGKDAQKHIEKVCTKIIDERN